MTVQENNQLRDLLEKKIQEYTNAIAYVTERCELDDMADEAFEETWHLRAARQTAKNFLHELRQPDDNWVEQTIENIKATQA